MIARYLAAGVVACILSFSANAQRSLESLVSDEGAEWMLGKWQGQSENGDTTTLNVSWDLEKHVIVLHVKSGETEAKGYTVVEPKSELPQFYSFDNKGAVVKGSWNKENDELVLRVESERADRETWKGAFVFTGSASSGLKVRMHKVDSAGDLATPAEATFKLKKQSETAKAQ